MKKTTTILATSALALSVSMRSAMVLMGCSLLLCLGGLTLRSLVLEGVHQLGLND